MFSVHFGIGFCGFLFLNIYRTTMIDLPQVMCGWDNYENFGTILCLTFLIRNFRGNNVLRILRVVDSSGLMLRKGYT